MTAVASAGAYLLSTPVELGPNTRGEPRRQPQRGTSEGCWRRLPGRAGGYPPGPPTDPDVRHERIRFLKQSRCCPCKDTLAPQSPGLLWVGLVSSESLPCIRPAEALCDGACPPVGRLGLTSPPAPGLCAATTAPFPSQVAALGARFPIPCLLPSCVLSHTGSSPGGRSRSRSGLWSPGPPIRV